MGYVNGNSLGATAAVDKKIAQDRAYQEAHAQQTSAPKNHPDLADIDRALSGITEIVRQVRARVGAVTDILVGETVSGQGVNPSPPPPTPCGGQMGALISSVQYVGYALQELQDATRRLENAIGVG